MALSSRETPGFYPEIRRKISAAAEQLDALRALAERRPIAQRREAEAQLDQLRGLLNRAAARLEAARIAGDDPMRSIAARAAAQSAVDELWDELALLESRLPLAA